MLQTRLTFHQLEMGHTARSLFHVATLVLTAVTQISSQDFRVQKIVGEPGLYYEDKGVVRLYNMQWKLITYVPFVDIKQKFNVAQLFADLTLRLCDRELRPVSGNAECDMLHREFKHRSSEIEKARDLILQLVTHGEENDREKRGILNFVGEIAKVLFGTLDNDDARFYKGKIDEIEQSGKEILELQHSQVMLVRSTLKAVNGTLTHLQENEFKFAEGLKDLAGKVQIFASDSSNRLHYVEVMSSLNSHLIQVYRIFAEVKANYELIISAIVRAKEGVLEPHIITPKQVAECLRKSHINLEQHSLPISISSPNLGSVLLKIADVDIVIFKDVLSYIVKIPLMERESYQLYELWSLPVPDKKIPNMYTFLETGNKLLLIDTAKRYLARLSYSDLNDCKVLNNMAKICRQTFNVYSTHNSEDCAFTLMSGSMTLPLDCTQRVVSLVNSLWNKLDKNLWIYVVPNKEKLTVLCQGKEPVDIILEGVGKLIFYESCKAYGNSILIQTQKMIVSNTTSKDFTPELNLQIDCCEELADKNRINVTSFQVKVPELNYLNHFDDLQVAGHKLDQLQKNIEEEKEKLSLRKYVYHYSVFTYIGVMLIFVVVLICCCRICKWFSWVRYFKFWGGTDSNCCARICIRNTVVNRDRAHNSDEELRINARPPLRSAVASVLGRHEILDASSVNLAMTTLDTTDKRNYEK